MKRQFFSAACARSLTVLLALLGVQVGNSRAALAPPPAATSASASLGDVRGITVSCWGWGWEWQSPGMHALLKEFPEVGANWVTIHPYAHVSRETGVVRWRKEPTAQIVQPIRWAHELGLKIMIKPHLSYWGEFAWRGEVGWGSDEKRWTAFRESYRAWVTWLAALCEREGADLFVVGTELRQTEGMQDWWQALIKDVRGAYRGPLTYAANFDDYERVGFWSQLDHVGVQAYFPLTSKPDPDLATLRAAWRGHAADLSRFSKKVGKPILLAEVGYTNSTEAAARPWEYHRGAGPSGIQARCVQAALEAVAATPAISGLFLWKWFPTTEEQGPDDFTIQTRGFKRLLREVWSRGVKKAREKRVPRADAVPPLKGE